MDLSTGWIDVSMPVRPGETPLWPGARPIEFAAKRSFGCGHLVNDTDLSFNLHTGTHIDAPSHFLAEGPGMSGVPLDSMIGPCWIGDFRGVNHIGAADLQKAAIPKHVKRLLMRTNNSDRWSPEFDPDFAALTREGAEWLAQNNFLLVGNDYLSIQLYKGDPETHRVLLKKNVVLIEGLRLDQTPPGEYDLFCLPMRLMDVEAAPARVIVRPR